MGNAAGIEQGATGRSDDFNTKVPLFRASERAPLELLQTSDYKRSPKYRTMLRDVVSSVLMEYRLVRRVERVKEDRSLPDSEIENMKKIIFAEVFVSISDWKKFLRKNWQILRYNEKSYFKMMFRVLWHIHDRRERDFFDNLLSGIAFVVLSTAYFCHNGMDEVLKHPIRILATFYETLQTGLWSNFISKGGYNGLAKHCSNNKEMLLVYDQIQLKPDRRSEELLSCLSNRAEKVRKALITSIKPSDLFGPEARTVDALMGYLDTGKHGNSNFRKKTKPRNKFFFQDEKFATSIIKSIEKEDCGARRIDKPQAEAKSSFRPPLVDAELVEKIESSLSGVNSRLCELDKMAELILDSDSE